MMETLGVIGGIFAILIGLSEVVLAIVGSSSGVDLNLLYTLFGICIVAGIIGIAGAALGKKPGAVLMIVGAVLSLIGGGWFGFFSFFLLLVGGMLAWREKLEPARANSANSPRTFLF
jgi:hypothetical protein